MPDTLDRIIEIIRENGYDRDKTADGSSRLLDLTDGDLSLAIDVLFEIEEHTDAEIPDTFCELTLGEIAIEVERQKRTLRSV